MRHLVNSLNCTGVTNNSFFPRHLFNKLEVGGFWFFLEKHPLWQAAELSRGSRRKQERRCDLARRVGLQETQWPTFSVSEMPSDAQHCATLHRERGSTIYSGWPDIEPRRGSPTARPVSSLNTHRRTVTHKGQAIKISECRALWLTVVTMATR